MAFLYNFYFFHAVDIFSEMKYTKIDILEKHEGYRLCIAKIFVVKATVMKTLWMNSRNPLRAVLRFNVMKE